MVFGSLPPLTDLSLILSIISYGKSQGPRDTQPTNKFDVSFRDESSYLKFLFVLLIYKLHTLLTLNMLSSTLCC